LNRLFAISVPVLTTTKKTVLGYFTDKIAFSESYVALKRLNLEGFLIPDPSPTPTKTFWSFERRETSTSSCPLLVASLGKES
jgi:hypothetical protein